MSPGRDSGLGGAGLYALVVAGVALAIGAAGSFPAAAVTGAVWIGVMLGYVAQVIGVWLFAVLLLPGNRLMAHGLGMVWRMIVVGIAAVFLLRAETAVAASMLFAMVAFFFVSTVLEPLFLRTEPLKRR